MQVGSRWIACWSRGNPEAHIWTVRGVTEHGVYITCPQSRSPGHLLSVKEFSRDYLPIESQPQTSSTKAG